MSINEKTYKPSSAVFKRRQERLKNLLMHTTISRICDTIGEPVGAPVRAALYRLKSGKYGLSKTSLMLSAKAMDKYERIKGIGKYYNVK